jgi:hypothetical protein
MIMNSCLLKHFQILMIIGFMALPLTASEAEACGPELIVQINTINVSGEPPIFYVKVRSSSGQVTQVSAQGREIFSAGSFSAGTYTVEIISGEIFHSNTVTLGCGIAAHIYEVTLDYGQIERGPPMIGDRQWRDIVASAEATFKEVADTAPIGFATEGECESVPPSGWDCESKVVNGISRFFKSIYTAGGSGPTPTPTATPPAGSYLLNIAKTGSGTVTTADSKINCGTTCSAGYASGATATLSASPASGYQFNGWTGDSDCSDGSVTMNANKSCTAQFGVQTTLYSTTVAIVGAGTVVGAGINCSNTGGICTAQYPGGVIGFVATPAAGYQFGSWSADCAGGSLTVNANKTCTVTFNSLPKPAVIISPAPGSQLNSATVRFDWGNGVGVTAYWLDIGTSQGGYNLVSQYEGLNSYATVGNLPTDGLPIWVRLHSRINGSYTFVDFKFIAASPPVITSLTSNRAFPIPVGDSAQWTVVASAGGSPLEYIWYVYDGSAWTSTTWSQTATSFHFIPKKTGLHNLQVWVRRVGSTASYDAYKAANDLSVVAPMSVQATGVTQGRYVWVRETNTICTQGYTCPINVAPDSYVEVLPQLAAIGTPVMITNFSPDCWGFVKARGGKVCSFNFAPSPSPIANGTSAMLVVRMQGPTGGSYMYVQEKNLICTASQVCTATVSAGSVLTVTPASVKGYVLKSASPSCLGQLVMNGPKDCTYTFGVAP